MGLLGEEKKDLHSPHNERWVLVCPYTSAATEKSNKICFITFLGSVKCSYTQKILIHPMNYEVALLFKILEIKRHQYPFIYVLEVS